MSQSSFNKVKAFVISLIAIIAILLMISFRQYQRNEKYRENNRELLLQNDSIMSINIELKEQLKEYKQAEYSIRNLEKKRPHGK